MKEATEHCVYWEDVDEQTFIRFAKWVYTRDYSPAEPELPTFTSSSTVTSTAEASGENTVTSLASFKTGGEEQGEVSCEDCDRTIHSSRSTKCTTCRASFTSAYCDNCGYYKYRTCARCRNVSTRLSKKQVVIQLFNNSVKFPSPTTTPYTPRKNTKSGQVYSEVFLSHARLYTLADKYGIKELCQLSLHRLYVTLKEFKPYPSRIGDIVGLTKYSFENTVKGDKLRTLLVDYCACIVEDMVGNKTFEDLVETSPDFAFELIKKMKDRLD